MPRQSSVYICQQCGYHSPTFLGKCPECSSWNSLVEQIEISAKGNNRTQISKLSQKNSEIINTSDIKKIDYDRVSTTISEFDRVLGGGIVKGSLVLVSGDPGIGKSTLLSQLALNVNSDDGKLKIEGSTLKMEGGKNDDTINSQSSTLKNPSSTLNSLSSKVLYVAGEESAQQIKLRIERIKKQANLAVLNEVDVDVITAVIEQVKPSLVIIDSIQTMQTSDLESVPGSVSQVREASHRIQRIAKSLHIPIFLVGHVTKEGTVAGPKTLEHLVDVVLSLEGDSANQFRILRADKNRFGPTDEVGIFEMEESGMTEVKNPSKLFLEQKVEAPGSAVIATVNGLRPLLVEVQALVTKTYSPIPRRVATGIDNGRLQILVAVLQKRLGLSLYDQDVLVNVTGGLKLNEPAVDLGVCLAIISSFKDQVITAKTVFVGEVGLLGELRVVRGLEKRISEAKKLGFENVVSFDNAKNLTEAVKLAFKKN